LKKIFKGEVLDGYVEAAKVKTLDTFFPKEHIVEDEDSKFKGQAPKAIMDTDPRIRRLLNNDMEEAKRQYKEYGEWDEWVFETMVPISKIEVPAPWSSSRLEENKKLLEATGAMPPIILGFDGSSQKYEIADGIHRTTSAKQLGYTHVPAVIDYLRIYNPSQRTGK